MAENDINQTMSITAQTATKIKNALQQAINQYPNQASEVQGYTKYTFLGFSCTNPMQIANILGPKFIRNFDPTLQSAIEELKQDDSINKSQLHLALLEKYFGTQNPGELTLEKSAQPNAYHSIPTKIDQDGKAEYTEDYYLHLYFLQPFRLFSITDENRKYIGTHDETKNRKWLWHENATNTDSAPLFRRIIQAYILSDILQCYQEKNNELQNDIIKTQLSTLGAFKNLLISQIIVDLINLFQNLHNPQIDLSSIKGNPQGLLDDKELLNVIELFLPGYMDIAMLYPIGRLLLGQPRQEPRHNLAMNSAKHPNKIIRGAQYSFAWLYEHLNISTSLFWIKTSLILSASIWKTFKEFVKSPNLDYKALVITGLARIIPNMFIIAATPFLMLLPAIYGISSLPFTLARSLVMYGPFKKLKNFFVLQLLDSAELIKDCFLFSWYVAPFAATMLAGLNAFIPASLLTAGFATSYLIILIGRACFGDTHRLLTTTYELASTHFFQLTGTLINIALTSYIGLAIIANKVSPHIPSSIITSLAYIATPLVFLGNQLNHLFELSSRIFTKPVELTNIVPSNSPQPTVIPTLSYRHIPKNLQATAENLIKQLGELNQAFNLSPARKNILKEAINKLALKEDTTIDSINTAVNNAKALFNDNFTQDQASLMQTLIAELENIPATEKAALRQARNQNRPYQPSWNMVQALHTHGLITDEGWSQRAKEMGCTDGMLEKCNHIEALKNRIGL